MDQRGARTLIRVSVNARNESTRQRRVLVLPVLRRHCLEDPPFVALLDPELRDGHLVLFGMSVNKENETYRLTSSDRTARYFPVVHEVAVLVAYGTRNKRQEHDMWYLRRRFARPLCRS